MKVKSLAKIVEKNKWTRFNFGLTPWGSLIESLLRITDRKMSDGEFLRRAKKGKFPYLDDEQFIPKTIQAFGLNYDDYRGLTIGLYKDEKIKAVVFAPIIPVEVETDEGEKTKTIVPCPLNPKDEFLPATILRNMNKLTVINL